MVPNIVFIILNIIYSTKYNIYGIVYGIWPHIPYTSHSHGIPHKDLNLWPPYLQSPTSTTLSSPHVHVHMWSHYTFITLMTKLVRQIDKLLWEIMKILKIQKLIN
jgi:hypothetical protein